MGQVLYSGDPFNTLTLQHNTQKLSTQKKHRFAMHIIIYIEKFASSRAELQVFFF